MASDGAAPFTTGYDDVTGDRVELSAITLDNWVAKTANLLSQGLAEPVGPGSPITVALPLHWQALPVLLGALRVGAAITLADPADTLPTDQQVVVCSAELAAPGLAPDVLALSLLPMGRGLDRPRPGITDYAGDIRVHGDQPEMAPADAAAATLRIGPGPSHDVEQLLQLAHRAADAWGLAPTDRLLTAAPLATRTGLCAALLAPLAAGASAVLLRPVATSTAGSTALVAPAPDMRRRAEQERVTCVVVAGLAVEPEPSGADRWRQLPEL